MEVAGLTLAVLSEVRAQATSVIKRIANAKNGPTRLADACACVTRLLLFVDAIQDIGARNYCSFPEEIFPLFRTSLIAVRDNLFSMKKKLEKHQVSTSSISYRLFWASWCDEHLNSIEQDAKYAERDVKDILGQLTSILVGKRMENCLFSSTFLAAVPLSSMTSLNISPFDDPVHRVLYTCAKHMPRSLWEANGRALVAKAIDSTNGSDALVDLITKSPLPNIPLAKRLFRLLPSHISACILDDVRVGRLIHVMAHCERRWIQNKPFEAEKREKTTPLRQCLGFRLAHKGGNSEELNEVFESISIALPAYCKEVSFFRNRLLSGLGEKLCKQQKQLLRDLFKPEILLSIYIGQAMPSCTIFFSAG